MRLESGVLREGGRGLSLGGGMHINDNMCAPHINVNNRFIQTWDTTITYQEPEDPAGA